MNELILDGSWTLFSCENPSQKIPAVLPGDNYSALVNAGLCPDPYYGKNELEIQKFRYESWNWERDFTVSEDLLSLPYLYLELSMVDTFCTVFVNEKAVCECGNAYAAYRPKIKRFLHPGQNTIRFAFRPIDAEAKLIAEKCGGNYPHSGDCLVEHLNQVRKPICSGGWDWGITLSAYGIYAPIRITGRKNASIRSIYTKQDHFQNKVKVTAVAEIFAEREGTETAEFRFNGESRSVSTVLHPGDNLVQTVFEVKNPRLWWPNGFGSPELYPLTVSTSIESETRQIGLRKLEVINEEDQYGFSLKFRVNGIDIIAKGADWIPCDAMPSGQTPERYEDLLESARISNMNMIRVWGGGQYEKDCFYEICDRKGLLVWQDMMFAVAIYPADDAFIRDVCMELEYQIRRLRSHACVAMWCGDNECIACLTWLPEEREQRLENYKKLNAALAEKVKELDPERTFRISSPSGRPGNFNKGWHNDKDGDMHYWEVWHGGKDFSANYSIKPRFCSEFGYQAFPSLETVSKFCPEEEYDVLSPTMSHHQKCHLGNQPILRMFEKYFRNPEGFANFLYLSQVQQALAIKTGVEYWRTLKPRCMGTLFWQFNDNWPVASWSSVEFGGKWKLLQYEARRFYNPVISVMLKTPEGKYELYAVSDLAEECEVTIREDCLSLSGIVAESHRHHVTLSPGESRLVQQYDAEYFSGFFPEQHFIELYTMAKGAGGKCYSHRNSFFFAAFRDMMLPDAEIQVQVRDDNTISLTTDLPAFFVTLDACGVPGIFSDNNFTLLPGETREINFQRKEPVSTEKLKSRLTVCHLRQTYGKE